MFYLMQAKHVADSGSATVRVSGLELGGAYGCMAWWNMRLSGLVDAISRKNSL